MSLQHRHDHEAAEESASPRRTPGVDEGPLLRAAAQGRSDVLGGRGMLAVQKSAGNGAAASLAGEDEGSVHEVLSSPGSALADDTRQEMESRMGQDFSQVRIHTDDGAHRSARSMSAHAYTVGSDIVFQRGAYDPGSTAGKTLLAHELTHVVQQRSGPVDGTPTEAGVSVSDPSDRFEREASAHATEVMSRPLAHDQAPVAGTAQPAAVQRESAEEDEELQASHDESLPGPLVQREQDPEEEEQTA